MIQNDNVTISEIQKIENETDQFYEQYWHEEDWYNWISYSGHERQTLLNNIKNKKILLVATAGWYILTMGSVHVVTGTFHTLT